MGLASEISLDTDVEPEDFRFRRYEDLEEVQRGRDALNANELNSLRCIQEAFYAEPETSSSVAGIGDVLHDRCRQG
jgi:hypothetical protein